jgi:hypothetical protein
MVDKTGDAIVLWQQMVGEMQKGFSAFTKQALTGQGPLGSADQAPGAPLGAQKQLAEFMEDYFIGMNLPSRTQFNDMAGRLQAVETQLSEIKALLQQMHKSPAPPESRPPRPRGRPAPPDPKAS